MLTYIAINTGRRLRYQGWRPDLYFLKAQPSENHLQELSAGGRGQSEACQARQHSIYDHCGTPQPLICLEGRMFYVLVVSLRNTSLFDAMYNHKAAAAVKLV